MIRVEHLRKNFSGKQVLSDVSFSVEPNSILALVGPNGAGKTTTVRCVTGVLKPDGGSITLFDAKFDHVDSHIVKQRIAVVPEERTVFKNFTGSDYAQLWSILYPGWDESTFSNFVARYEFDLSQKVESYSIGMKTLFLVGLCICSQADLLILDEPTQHLDPTARLEVMSLLKGYVDDRRSAIVCSHEIFELEEYATHLAIMKEGRIIYADSIDAAKEKHRLIERGETFEKGEIIGLVGQAVLVRTDADIGRFPKLSEIVVGYLAGKSERKLALK
ncbi:ABC transporter ATP-binding protein [Thermotoga sp. Ku-13t]|uniref:ABC transporter ATP-binding protein n=1 Tax=Thermotoga sp. Ku-13t TaxID=1755813 RepID=UPI0013EA2A8B|nr:ABC transporter ATP-binding protein [Thermotoga sp. Ku-13t]KAF2958252.1 ABC transporter ATP-binding protein [Thermotoga sp. Ku-13t]